jgi:uncharacterized membrane protein
MLNKLFKLFVIVLFLFSLASLFPHITHADPPDELDPQETYNRAVVLQVLSGGIQKFAGSVTYNENLKVQLLEGSENGKIITVPYSTDARFGIKQKLGRGSLVIIDSKPIPSQGMYYVLYEPYRLNNLWWLLGFFCVLTILVVGKKGIGALVGLAISLIVILDYVLPQILKGQDALFVCCTGAIVILFVTTYVAHGISLKTTVALIGTAISLVIAAVLATLAANFTYLLGLGDQNSYALQLTTTAQINPQGLLLGGIIIGTLGALNDVTTTQSITIFTLAKENPRQLVSHLFWKSMHIGREHIISMINTLVLAYAGSSLVIFLFFTFNPANLPWWLLLNDQTVMEEIIRSLVGSTALILAVPITTYIACWVSLNREKIFKRLSFKWV